MSTKSTIFVSEDNEHWFRDAGHSYKDVTTEDVLVVEFDAKHIIETDEDGTLLVIQSDTDLYKKLMEAARRCIP